MINYISLILVAIFILPILKGIISKFDIKYSEKEIKSVEISVSFLLALIASNYIINNYVLNRGSLLYFNHYSRLFTFISHNFYIIYFIIFPLVLLFLQRIIYLVFCLINNITFFPFMKLINRAIINKNNFVKGITGALFQLPRALCNIIFLVFILNIAIEFNIPDSFAEKIQTSKVYMEITEKVVKPAANSTLAKAVPRIIDKSFKVQIKDGSNVTIWEDIKSLKDLALNNNQIIYYNGVTLEEAIKSDEKIDYASRYLTEGLESDRSKARTLYTYVGSNILYDDDKAERILNNDFSVPSGAIEAFKSKKGICFDYASLYAAMCIASDLKVRIVTGEGYNGTEWISHAWNEVYLAEEDIWIPVDTTFYKGGNYFNSDRFNLDHREDQVIGQW